MNFESPFRALKSLVVSALFIVFLNPIPRLVAAPAAPGLSKVILDTFQPVLSDFDSDRKIDRATLRHSGSHKTIHIVNGRSSWTALSFESNTTDRGALVSSDIDHDGDADLVWISTSADRYIAWLGDGFGNFSVRNRDIDANQLESFWWSSSPSSVQPGNRASPTAILTAIYGNLCNVPGCDLRLLPQIFHFPSIRLDASLLFVPVLQLRGPPSIPFNE